MGNNKNRIIDLIKKLYSLLVSNEANLNSSYKFISKHGYGTFFMTVEALECYDEIIDLIIKEYGRKDILSRRNTNKLLDETLFHIHKTRPQEEDNYGLLLDGFFKSLSDPKKKYTFFIPILGCELKKPLEFGKIQFDVFNDNIFNRFSDSVDQHKIDKTNKIYLLEQVKKSNLWETPVAEVKVAAKDRFAAKDMAFREVLQIINTLNFLSEVSIFRGKLYLSGVRYSDYAVFPSIEEDHSFNIAYERVGPHGKLNLEGIRKELQTRQLFSKLDSMLKNEAKKYIEGVFLTSIQWAGQASVEPMLSNEFLAYTIALESILLPDPDHQSLGYKLKHRIANLLGITKENKFTIFNEVGILYKIRSQIVHDGWSSVTPENVLQIKDYCLRTVLKLIDNPDVNQVKNRDEFTRWLNALTLS